MLTNTPNNVRTHGKNVLNLVNFNITRNHTICIIFKLQLLIKYT